MSLPSPCRFVNASRSHTAEVFCSLFMLHIAEAMHQAQKHLNKGSVCMALQVFTCTTDSYQAFRMYLQRQANSCSNSSNLQTAALCFPKPHREATEKDQSSHCGNSGISAADSVACELYCSPQLPEKR